MRDLDGAVRRLDDIFMVVVFVIAILVLAAAIVCLFDNEPRTTLLTRCRLPRLPPLSLLPVHLSSVSLG